MTLLSNDPVLDLKWNGKYGFWNQWVWEQGQHITFIGPTDAGKTSLEIELLKRRDYILFLSTKRIFDKLPRMERMGYKVIHDVNELHPEIAPRCILRPPWPNNASADELLSIHKEIFREALMRVFHQGYWTVVLDEARYLTKDLGLATECQLLWLQGRELRISVVAGTQRPRWIPLEAYDMATHLFFWKDNDLENVRREAELAGINRGLVSQIVPNLRKHFFLYYNKDTNEMVTTKLPKELAQ